MRRREGGRKEAQSPNHHSQIPQRLKEEKFQDCKTAITAENRNDTAMHGGKSKTH